MWSSTGQGGDVVIRVEGLGKRYRLGGRRGHGTLSEAVHAALLSPVRAARSWVGQKTDPETVDEKSIWALKDVSFQVKRGEVVGIIGRNGAGKSTVLKILSNITGPNEGYADIYGRVGSLLEVGTGFHPDLTGRENIYLNGAILGMRRAEVQRKFDEIVAFAETERFLDTAVKWYSSGMYMRLAFAVAAHFEPEILMVDEVLAVGDAQFQKKCFQKMKSIGQGGRTILFVSHNMAAIRHICDRALIIEDGRIVADGEANEAVDQYLVRSRNDECQRGAVETESFLVHDVEIRSSTGPVIKTFDPVEIRVRFTAKTHIHDPGLYVAVLSMDHLRLAGIDFRDFATVPPIRASEDAELGFCLDELPILPGEYKLEVSLKDRAADKTEPVPGMFSFEVAASPVYGGREIRPWHGCIGLHARAHATRAAEPVTDRCG
jgi:lipopolysaccharide transport system ATP-binding protein